LLIPITVFLDFVTRNTAPQKVSPAADTLLTIG
jgi:hypothetical protein